MARDKDRGIYDWICDGFQTWQLHRSKVCSRRFARYRRACREGEVRGPPTEEEYFKELFEDAAKRKQQGDPFPYHPTEYEGIADGEIALGRELVSNALWRINVSRLPGQSHVVVHTNISGPNHFGKTTLAAWFCRKVVRRGIARVLALDRFDGLADYLGEDRYLFKVVRWHELPGFCVFENDRQVTHIAELLAQIHERHDSRFVLSQIVADLREGRKQMGKSPAVGIRDVLRVCEKEPFKRDWKAKEYAKNWVRIFTDLLNKTGKLFDAARTMDLEQLMKNNVIISMDGLEGHELRFFVLFLFLLIADISGICAKMETLFVWDEAQLHLTDKVALVADTVPTLRHKGIHLVTISQDPMKLSPLVLQNSTLLVMAGPLLGQDAKVYLGEMGVQPREGWPLLEWARSLQPGQGIACHKGGPYPYPFPLTYPYIPRASVSEEERKASIQGFLKAITPSQQDAKPEPEIKVNQEEKDKEDIDARFVRTVADPQFCFRSTQEKFVHLGVRSRDQQKRIVNRCIAQGWIKQKIAQALTGKRGPRIQLLEVTQLACDQLDLENPVRGNESITAQYYQHRIAEAVENLGSHFTAKVQGTIGKDLKRVDVLVADSRDDRMVTIEVACPGDRHEAPNLKADLIDNPELVRKHIIVCEDDKVMSTVFRDIGRFPGIDKFKNRIAITTFTLFMRDTKLFMESEQV